MLPSGEAESSTSISTAEAPISLLRRRLRNDSRVAGACALPHQRIEHALLGGGFGARAHFAAAALARHVERDFDQIAHDLLDVAPDIADLGELGGFDLEERRAGEPGEAARDLGLADAGRADHQDVLRRHFLAQILRQLLAPPAVAQGDGDGALGVVLADDEAIEFGDDLARGEMGHAPQHLGGRSGCVKGAAVEAAPRIRQQPARAGRCAPTRRRA